MHVEVTEKTHHQRNTRIWWDVPDWSHNFSARCSTTSNLTACSVSETKLGKLCASIVGLVLQFKVTCFYSGDKNLTFHNPIIKKICEYRRFIIQGDQKVSVHLLIVL